jgi:hypothetical protein
MTAVLQGWREADSTLPQPQQQHQQRPPPDAGDARPSAAPVQSSGSAVRLVDSGGSAGNISSRQPAPPGAGVHKPSAAPATSRRASVVESPEILRRPSLAELAELSSPGSRAGGRRRSVIDDGSEARSPFGRRRSVAVEPLPPPALPPPVAEDEEEVHLSSRQRRMARYRTGDVATMALPTFADSGTVPEDEAVSSRRATAVAAVFQQALQEAVAAAAEPGELAVPPADVSALNEGLVSEGEDEAGEPLPFRLLRPVSAELGEDMSVQRWRANSPPRRVQSPTRRAIELDVPAPQFWENAGLTPRSSPAARLPADRPASPDRPLSPSRSPRPAADATGSIPRYGCAHGTPAPLAQN